MKIESIKFSYPISYKGIKKESSIPKTLSSEKSLTSSLDSTSIIGKAQVLSQNKLSEEELLLQKIFHNKNLNCTLLGNYWDNKIYKIQATPKQHKPDAYVNIYYDDKEDIENVYLFDVKEESFYIYDNKGKLTRHFTTDDLKSISMYKLNSTYFHTRLRYGNDFGNNEHLEHLEKLFTLKEKLDIAKEDFTVYRASQLIPEEIGEEGEIYQDQSFLSTTKEEGIAHSFHDLRNAFLKITIPKGATYLDIDRLFNIKSNRSHEKEILLDKNAQYLIEDVDTTTNEVCLRMLIE